MDISAAILAGGSARRFGGRDKATLVVDGVPIRDHQLALLSPLTDDLMIVGGPGEAPAGVRRLQDLVPGCGPLGGLYTALTASTHPATLIVACDMPFVSAPFLRHIMSLAGENDIVVPRTEGEYHPLCAAYTRACLDLVKRRLDARQLKMTDLFGDVQVRVIADEEIRRFGDPRRLLANVNTPGEYHRIAALQSH